MIRQKKSVRSESQRCQLPNIGSKEMRDRADKGVPPEVLFQNPDAYVGRVVVLGGCIVSTAVTDDGSYIEVVQNPLDSMGRPGDRDIPPEGPSSFLKAVSIQPFIRQAAR